MLFNTIDTLAYLEAILEVVVLEHHQETDQTWKDTPTDR